MTGIFELSDRNYTSGLRANYQRINFDNIIIISFLMVSSFYQMSPEMELFSGISQSQPKLLDLIIFLFVPAVLFSKVLSGHFSLVGFHFIFFVFLILSYFAQLLSAILNGTGLPQFLHFLRFLQYSFMFLMVNISLRRFGYWKCLNVFLAGATISFLVVFLRFFIEDDATNSNKIGLFRGSFDAGAYFCLSFSILLKVRREAAAIFAKKKMMLYFFSVCGGLLLSSSRTAVVVSLVVFAMHLFVRSKASIVLLLGNIFAWSLGCYESVFGLLASLFGIYSNKLRVLTLSLSRPSALTEFLATDRSLLMRIDSFNAHLDHIAKSGGAFEFLFGGGAGKFQEYVSLYGLPGTFDNMYVRAHAEFGLLGVCLLLMVIYRILIYSREIGVAVLLLGLTLDLYATSKVIPLLGLIFYSSKYLVLNKGWIRDECNVRRVGR